MNFSSQTDVLMKPFINSFGKCEPESLDKSETKKVNEVLISLYQDIYKANELVIKAGCFKQQLLSLKDKENKNPELYNSRYFPTLIKKYISDNELYQLIFSCNIGSREINIHFTLFSEEDKVNNLEKYVQRARQIYEWLHICSKYAAVTCLKTLDIYIYLTPFTKNLPESSSTVLGPEHINTAFTYACVPEGQLILFREEEWFKVFIHETFHAYGLDFANSKDVGLHESLAALFPIKSDFDIYEAYTETWARIINCAFSSFKSLTNKKDKSTFLLNLRFCLNMERMFALYQCNKILGFMGLQYQDLHSHQGQSYSLYKENTHVFAYYVMTSIFLNDYEGFILWCKKHNTAAVIKFEPTPLNFNAFTDYIKTVYNCQSYQNGLVYMDKLIKQVNRGGEKNKLLTKTTRMSIIH